MAPVRWRKVALLVPGFVAFGFLRGQMAGFPANNAVQQEGTKIRITTQEVLVDAVVRDKHQKLIRGLEAGDFEVLEDGVPQQIKMFRFVGGKEAASGEDRPSEPGAATQQRRGLDPLRQINLISLAVMPSGPDGRVNFRNAARALVGQGLQPNTYMGVFLIDPLSGARMIHDFTDDSAVLLGTIDRLASMPAPPETTDGIDSLLNQTPPYAVPIRLSQTQEPASSLLSIGMQAWESDLIFCMTSQRQLLGMLAFVKSLAELPGRKTVLLFSEGIQVAGDVTDLFRSVISTANRGQVTFYAFDLRSLGMAPELLQSRTLLNRATEESARMVTDPNYIGSDAMGTAIDSLHSYPPGNLEELADGTGGFKVTARGAASEALRRISEDMQTHYEVSYIPKSTIMDGRFRKIEVRVHRPNAMVHSRNGYYALPLLPGQTLFPFELGAMNALAASPPPRAFPFHVSALRFRSGDQATLFSLGYEIAGSDLKPAVDKDHKRFEVRVCLFSLIKDEHGEVVKKVSQEVPLTGPLTALQSFGQGSIIATQPFILPPGRYTVESAVIAREQNAASTSRTSLVVPPRTRLGVSDLVLVNSLEETRQENARQFDPLVTAMGRIRPELNPVIAVHPGTKMALYFQVYASPAAQQPQIGIEIKRNGIAVGSLAPKPLPALAGGVLPYFTALDVGELTPGSYVTRVKVQQGTSVAQQSLAFEVGDRSVPDARQNPAGARLAR